MRDARPLDSAHLAEVLGRVHETLRSHRVEVDELNVFPVPDGDTGTNMAMTADAAVTAARGEGEDAPATGATDSERVRAVVRAAMRGARGNSGVILSQVLRALAEAVDELGPLDAMGYATFLRRSRELAYEAVADPVEGTILTAIAVAAETAALCEDQGDDLVDAAATVRLAVHAAVARTTEQLEALRHAGVVDAGARGFELVVEAIHAYLCGDDIPVTAPPRSHVQRARGEIAMREAGSLEFRFEVQYLLDAPDGSAGALRSSLECFGDSVVVVAAGGLTSVHVHTNDVGAVVEEGLRFGRPSRIEVTYFADQIGGMDAATVADALRERSSRGDTRTATVSGEEPDDPPPERARLGCIVVLPGPGLRDLAERYDAVVVEGASGALPSVADLLNAIGDVDADRIVILPGHRNVVPTAHQASNVSVAEGGRTLDVLDTATTPTRALAALAMCDAFADPEAVLEDMSHAADAVRSGEVVAAVRDAETPVGEVREGQHLAVCDGVVVGVHDDPVDALRQVAERCAGDLCELVTLVTGADVDREERSRAITAVRESVGAAEVELVDGKQRPARYLVGCE